MLSKINTVVLLFISFFSLYAQTGTWVETAGSAYASNITPEEARRQALNEARSEAIKQVVGVKVREETFSNVAEVMTGTNASEFSDLFSKFNRTSSYGKIVEEIVTDLPPSFEGNIPVYKVSLRARVVEEEGKHDPGFTAEIILKNPVLYDRGDLDKNDVIDFKLWASRDSYLYLFNILSNDSVQLVLPNSNLSDNRYVAGAKEQNYEKIIKEIGMTFPVGLPYGKTLAVEGLMLIALKTKIDFKSARLSRDGMNILPTYQAALTDIMNWLVQIPLDQRTEAFASFEVRRR